MLGLRRIQRTISVPSIYSFNTFSASLRSSSPHDFQSYKNSSYCKWRTFCNKSYRNDDNLSTKEIVIISLLYGGGMGGGTYGLCDGYMKSREEDFFTCVGATTTFGIIGFLSGTGLIVLSPIIIPIGCIVYGVRCLDKTT